MKKALRILVLAQQNNPEWVSVPLVGFHHSEALCHENEITLITHAENVGAIEKLRLPWKRVIGIHLGIWERFYDWAFRVIFKGDHGSQALTAFRLPFYLAFEWLAWRRVQREIKGGEFDLILRLTPVAPVIPSPIATWAKRRGLPFVIGPINGGLPWPKGFAQAEKQKEWISQLRQVYRFLPYARSTYRDAAAIIAGSSQTYSEFKAHGDRLFFIPENGIVASRIKPKAPRSSGVLHLLFVGRLVPFKACDLAIRGAASLIQAGKVRLTIVGDGQEREPLEGLAKGLGLGAGVQFTGLLQHGDAMRRYQDADVLVFPSIREFGGGVVFEAFSTGVIPIVSDYGGPGDIVPDESVGFKIPIRGEDFIVQEIQRILTELCHDPERVVRMSLAGQQYARDHLSWQGKAQKMSEIMEWCLQRRPRPDLKPPAS